MTALEVGVALECVVEDEFLAEGDIRLLVMFYQSLSV
jgi:hypothetical protein